MTSKQPTPEPKPGTKPKVPAPVPATKAPAPVPASASASATGDRGADGRFAAHNTIGRLGGRPPKEIEGAYLSAFTAGCPVDQLEAIVRMLAEKAAAGCLTASALILKHALPSGALKVEVDVREYRCAGQSPASHQRDMVRYIVQEAQKRTEYEAKLAAEGVRFGRIDPSNN